MNCNLLLLSSPRGPSNASNEHTTTYLGRRQRTCVSLIIYRMRNTAVTAILALLSRQQNSSSPREQKQQPSTTAEPSTNLTAMVAPPDQQQLKQQESSSSATSAATALGASPSSSCSSSNPASGEADSPAVTSAPLQLTRRPSEPGVIYWTDGKAKTMPLFLRAVAMLSLLLFVSWIWIIGFNLVFAPFSRVSATIAVCLWATLLLPTAVSTPPSHQQQLLPAAVAC